MRSSAGRIALVVRLVGVLAMASAAISCAFEVDYRGSAFACEGGGTCPLGYDCVADRCILPGDTGGADGGLSPQPDAATADAAVGATGADADLAQCGNGYAEDDEDCDDGNQDATDACLPDCTWARCGDGHVRAGVEDCDDGDQLSGPLCTSSCLACTGADSAAVDEATGHCYRGFDAQDTQVEAVAACAALGDHLLTITSAGEQQVITTALEGLGDEWIGLEDRAQEGTFVWITGEANVFDNAEPGEPNGSGDCVIQGPVDRTWRDRDCTDTEPYVCEREPWTLRSSDNHAYRAQWRRRAVTGAALDCVAQGGHLAELANLGEGQFAASLLPLGSFWIGPPASCQALVVGAPGAAAVQMLPCDTPLYSLCEVD